MTFAQLIQTWMRSDSLTTNGAAFRLKCTRPTIANWCSGATLPTKTQVGHIARVLKRSREEIAHAIGESLARP